MSQTMLSELRRAVLKRCALALIGLSGLAPALAQATPPPPDVLQPYIVDGTLPIASDWVRWRFSDKAADRAKWRAVLAWAHEVAAERKVAVVAAVARHGVTLGGVNAARPHGYGEPVCDRILAIDFNASSFKTWTRFSHALREVQPVFDGYRLAVEAAQHWAAEELPPSLAGEIEKHTIAEQLYRLDSILLPVARDQAPLVAFHANAPLALSDDGKQMLQLLMRIAYSEEDLRVTAWFKGVIAKGGFPMPKDVGNKAWEAAWRIVRHADHDPEFQMEALDALRAATVERGTSGDFYATHVDQVLPDVTGKQRYGTQVICKDGALALIPLEDEARVEELREAVGLFSLAEQEKMVPPEFCK